MTTYIPFLPVATAAPPFQTSVTLDGNSYGLTVGSNLYRADWYFTLTDQNRNRIVTKPLIGSPNEGDINLVGGYFTSTMIYRGTTGNFEITP